MLQVQPKNINEQLAEQDRTFDRITNPSSSDIAPIANAVTQAFDENFTSESSNNGRWQSLTRATQRDRARRGYAAAHPILVRSGDYKSSFVNRGNSDHVERLDVDGEMWSVLVGTRHRLARFHESDEPRTIIPQRRVIALTAAQEERVSNSMRHFLQGI